MMLKSNSNPMMIVLMVIISINGIQAQTAKDSYYKRPTKMTSTTETAPIATILPIGSATEIKGPGNTPSTSTTVSTPFPSESANTSSKSATSVPTTTSPGTGPNSQVSDGSNHSGITLPLPTHSPTSNTKDVYNRPSTSWAVGTPLSRVAEPSNSASTKPGSQNPEPTEMIGEALSITFDPMPHSTKEYTKPKKPNHKGTYKMPKAGKYKIDDC